MKKLSSNTQSLKISLGIAYELLFLFFSFFSVSRVFFYSWLVAIVWSHSVDDARIDCHDFFVSV